MQKRTAFETALVRRIPKKADFLRYATYEMSLEALRKKRVERLSTSSLVRTLWNDIEPIACGLQNYQRARHRCPTTRSSGDSSRFLSAP